MSPRERQLARLLRALIACGALLFAFAPPSFAAGAPRDTSGWIAERIAVAVATRATAPSPEASRRAARPWHSAPAPALAHATPPPHAIPPPHATGRRTLFDARHRYLELRTLLC
ncbi:MAG TPA: hypothetical protein VFS67_24790 [Polyangiaceae bacterium]|nr:hypothetical protein [Polyangiaceae bacterium]